MTNTLITKPTIKLIATTTFYPEETGVPWEPDTIIDPQNPDQLAEFAGRACYESWDRPNAKTATNKSYLAHILDVGHFSVLEHSSATFYLTGVSRSLTHELVRHRHLSYSQLSQRYVDSKDAGIVVPPEIQTDVYASSVVSNAMYDAVDAYEKLVGTLKTQLELQGVKGTEARKRARQAARAVMPNMTETKIVVTGNFRAWRDVIDRRATAAADTEIRIVAIEILRQLKEIAPNTFQDYFIYTDDEGREIATHDRSEG